MEIETDEDGMCPFDHYVLKLWEEVGTQEVLLQAVPGLGEEVGEVLKLYKVAAKQHGDYHQVDQQELLNEAGDVLHYLTVLLNHRGVSIAQAMQANVRKMDRRYRGR